MPILKLDYLSRVVARNLLDTVANQKGDAVRRIVAIRRGLRLGALREELEGIERLTDESLLGYSIENYELERADLEWLRDQLQAKDWSERYTDQGQKVSLPMPSSYLEGVANLMDAVAEALMGK